MYAGIFLLSAATLALEVSLTRTFALAQWYHFAFMAVAIALLGAGASGSLLAAAGPGNGARRASAAAAGFVATTLCIYPLANAIPSMPTAWLSIEPDPLPSPVHPGSQRAVPLLRTGAGGLAVYAAGAIRALYGANLLGAGAGCLLALVALPAVGDGMPLLAGGLGLLALAALLWQRGRRGAPLLACALLALLLGVAALHPPGPFSVRLSPYKTLSIISSFQGSRHVLSNPTPSAGWMWWKGRQSALLRA